MIPHEKALVQRLKDEPFTILGINTDPLDVYREKREVFGVNWPSIHDGGSTKGPIVRRWGVTGFPSIYLIDHLGRIRFKSLADSQLDAAIDQLLREQRGELPSPPTSELLEVSQGPIEASAAPAPKPSAPKPSAPKPAVGRLQGLGGPPKGGGR